MSVELCFEFERAHSERLAHAERLLRWVIQIYRRAMSGFDVAYDGPRRTMYAFARLRQERFGSVDHQRIGFWVARAGGRVRNVCEIPAPEWDALQHTLSRCDVRAIGVEPSAATKSVAAIATAAGLAGDRSCYADDRPTLAIDIGGPGWDAVRWNDADESLFIASPLAPPLGDPVPVLFRMKGMTRVAVEWARVVEVRTSADAEPGRPAGFALGLSTAPRELRRQLALSAPTVTYGTRAAPRFQCTRPLEASFQSGGRLQVGLVENLSFGGAFVRTSAPPPLGTELELTCRLPTGGQILCRGVVAFVDVRGMGVRFVLDPRSMTEIREAMTFLAARPRRALVVDDDALVRRLVADALVERGFEVITATDALEGLRALSEEILSLDLLVTDMRLPGRSGEELVTTIRETGGEADLVVGVMTGSPDGALTARLLRAGADLVLGKELGPEIIAMKLDTLLEERVTGQRARASRASQGPIAGASASGRRPESAEAVAP